ncbi:MAG: SgcJ/EcaC family oxidoreductase [Gammaproteobacteria bacterium]|nr:SgcJ/EcaC family oxidoreductase [Gammaproteobacteria bacterium]
MRKKIYLASLVGLLSAGLAVASTQRDISNEIKTVIYAYGKAMNESDVEAVVKLYAEDGIFIPSGLPTAVGRKEIREAYKHEFDTIDLDVNIAIDEVQHEGNMAYARSRSLGQLTVLANGEKKSTEHYRAFFVLKKIRNDWKISRFTFNFSN